LGIEWIPAHSSRRAGPKGEWNTSRWIGEEQMTEHREKSVGLAYSSLACIRTVRTTDAALADRTLELCALDTKQPVTDPADTPDFLGFVHHAIAAGTDTHRIDSSRPERAGLEPGHHFRADRIRLHSHLARRGDPIPVLLDL